MAVSDERLRNVAPLDSKATIVDVTPRPRLLEQKVCLVTGASSGIGRAAAVVFARHGARVLVAARRADECRVTARMVEDEGSEALPVQADMTVAKDVDAMVRRGVEAFGRFDAAFNNAGTHGPIGRLHEQSEEAWDSVVQTNLKSVWLCLRAEVRQMLAQGKGGSIVNTASTAGLVGIAGSGAYSASKHAVVGITRTAALEYASKRIRVNALCPGVTRTPLLEELMGGDAAKEKQLSGFPPMRRLATPEEIAEAAAFLCSDGAAYITGAALAVDGGWTAG